MFAHFTRSASAAALFLLLWQSVSLLAADGSTLPGPWETVANTLPRFAVGYYEEQSISRGLHVLGWAAADSAGRALSGLILGVSIAVPIGLAIGRAVRSCPVLRPMFPVGTLKNVPLFALVPLFTYWFSGQHFAVIGYTTSCVVILVLPAAVVASTRVPQHLVDMFQLAGLSSPQVLLRLYLPSTIQSLLPTVRWCTGLAWAFALGAEYVGSPATGLGVLVYHAYSWADFPRLVALSGVYFAIGLCSVAVLDLLLLALPLRMRTEVSPQGA